MSRGITLVLCWNTFLCQVTLLGTWLLTVGDTSTESPHFRRPLWAFYNVVDVTIRLLQP